MFTVPHLIQNYKSSYDSGLINKHIMCFS